MVVKKINAVKDNKSPGLDGIPPKLLMETVEQISISRELKEGVVLLNGKKQTLFKKGLRNKSVNYRLVS